MGNIYGVKLSEGDYVIVETMAIKFMIDLSLLFAVIKRESSFEKDQITNEVSVNDKSYGLMQIRYDTASSMGFKGDINDLLKVEINTYYGCRYLKSRLDKFPDLRLAIGSYNSGTPLFKMPDGKHVYYDYKKFFIIRDKKIIEVTGYDPAKINEYVLYNEKYVQDILRYMNEYKLKKKSQKN